MHRSLPPGLKGPAYKETGSDFKDMSAAAVNWRQFYTDEKLQTVIEMALRNNRDLRIAALNIEKMRAVYGISRLVVLPLPDANGSLNYYRTPMDLAENQDARNVRVYNANFGVTSWEIDFFGRIRSLSRACASAILRYRACAKRCPDRADRRGRKQVYTPCGGP